MYIYTCTYVYIHVQAPAHLYMCVCVYICTSTLAQLKNGLTIKDPGLRLKTLVVY